METKGKIYLEYYNGKYCKFPDNVKCENTHGENFLLAGWIVYNKSTKKFLTYNKEMDPAHTGFIFNGDGDVSKIDNLVILTPGDTMLEAMELSNEEEHSYVTLKDLESEDVSFIGLFREKLWIKISSRRFGEGVKIYAKVATIGSKEFTIPELGLDDIPKTGFIWDGYYLGNKRVDEHTVFTAEEAGSHIISTYNSKPIVSIMWKDEKIKSFFVDLGVETLLDRLPIKYGYEFAGIYDNPEYTGEPLESITVTEDTTLYAKYRKEVYVMIYREGLLDMIHGYEGDNAQESIDFVKSELDRLSFNLAGMYYDKDYKNPITEPFILPGEDTKIYIKDSPKKNIMINVRAFIENESIDNTETIINAYKTEGIYDPETKSYIVRDVVWRKNEYGFVEFGARENGTDYSDYYRAKVDESGMYISIPHKRTYALELIPKYAKDVTWRIKNVWYDPASECGTVMTDKIFDEEFVIPFSTEKHNEWFAPITLDKYDEGDFVENDSELALTGRVFADINCTTKVLSPVISGNNVSVYYMGHDDIDLPVAYRKVNKRGFMRLEIVDCGSGKIEPTSFVVLTGQSVELTEDKFNTINAPEGMVFDKFTYTRPNETKERELLIGQSIIMDRSIDLIAHWTKPIVATFKVKDKVISTIIAEKRGPLTFTIPAVTEVFDDEVFIGWDKMDQTSGEFTIEEDTVFNAVFHPVELL